VGSLTKKPIQVYLRPEQVEPLRDLARRRNVSVAELVRQGIDRVLAAVPPEDDPLLGIIGLVDDDGPTDMAEKHDDYLVKWIQEENRSWDPKSS